ncbi:MAG: RnfABCDGE type electron transport complex subunit B [Oscillospiraceae bacterium]|nr:RnfABCDGE type electron transport complex subunit B [Oscillospiraceae bacterium]
MSPIITAVVVVAGIGVVCAVLLSVASKLMAVQVDERIPKVRECLPGANCGGCGYPGCDGYAAAIVEDESTPINLCAPGGPATAEAIGQVLGREVGAIVKQSAFVHCRGDCGVTGRKDDFQGEKTCAAAKLLFSGDKKCAYGCLGYGDCERACPEDAIHVVDTLARVDPDRCIACGICVRTSPQHIISIRAESTPVVVKCSNHYKGKNVVTEKCTAGCFGCSVCSIKCPEKAITMVDDLPVIDPEKCVGCQTCVKVCPAKCILPRKPLA